MKNEIKRPVGLDIICADIEKICATPEAYRYGLKPNHMIVNIDSGKTELIEFITDKFKQANVMSFFSGPDDYVIVSFDGTLPQLKETFAEIDSAAVYENSYSNIVGMDISALSNHLLETQVELFLKEAKRIAEKAFIVFFVHSMPTKNDLQLIEKVCKTVDNIKRYTIEPLSKNDIANVIISMADQLGIKVSSSNAFTKILSELIEEFQISNAEGAKMIVNHLLQVADYTDANRPFINEKSLKTAVNMLRARTKGSAF